MEIDKYLERKIESIVNKKIQDRDNIVFKQILENELYNIANDLNERFESFYDYMIQITEDKIADKFTDEHITIISRLDETQRRIEEEIDKIGVFAEKMINKFEKDLEKEYKDKLNIKNIISEINSY